MIGISSSWFAMKGMSVKESIERGFELGFELVEIGAAHKYEDNAVETVLELRKKYPSKKFTLHGLFPHFKNGNYPLNLADPKEHDRTLSAIKKMFEIGERITVDVIGIHGGFAGEVKWGEEEFGFEELVMETPIPIETAKRNMGVITEELVNIAEEMGIKVAMEISAPGPFAPIMTNIESFKWLFSNFKSKYLGLLLDIGHLHQSSCAESYNPYEFTKKFKSKIFELHLHDYKDDNKHIAVGAGEIDFEKYFKIIGRPKLEKLPLVFEYNNSVTEKEALAGRALTENLLTG